MTRYSDPSVCPDCRALLPADPAACPACSLPLRHPLSGELLATLRRADSLLEALRAVQRASLAAPVPDRAAAPVVVPAARRGLRGASVPTVLLGLGALCLLVAAVTFLAVAWSWLGVGGRTAVLVACTAATGVAGCWLARRGLPVAAEALTTVSLGLIALDLVGAVDAGWLGDPGPAGTLCLVGAGLLIASLGLLLASERLVAPQVVAVVGAGTLTLGALGATDHASTVLTVAVLGLAALAALGRASSRRPLAVLAAATAVLWWVPLAGEGLDGAADHLSWRGLWLEGYGGPLLAATLLLLLPALLGRDRRAVVAASSAATASLATLLVALPVLDEGATAAGTAALAALLAWATTTTVLPAPWRVVGRVPLVLSSLPVLGLAVLLGVQAATRVLEVPGSAGVGVVLSGSPALADPLLLLPLVLGLVLAATAALAHRGPRPTVLAGAAAPALAATLALLPVPLALVAATLSLAGTAANGLALRGPARAATPTASYGGLLLLLGLGASLPSPALTTTAAAALALVAGAVLAAGVLPGAAAGAGALLPLAAATAVWTGGEVLGVDPTLRGVAVLLVVGGAALALPRRPVELGALVAGLLASTAAVDGSPDPATWAAVHLSVAGALVTTTALVHPDRRRAAWPGGLLLAAATWVRLADLGVSAPEAYTLPTATVLLLVGLARLRRDPGAGTTTALLPGLVLATVPTLLWVLAGDPVSPRAALLGGGCLALVLLGTRWRWSAPLGVGAAAGGLLVLREAAPYAAATPQWVLIGLAGTLLTVVGVTWEHRLRDLQQAAGYLGRLR